MTILLQISTFSLILVGMLHPASHCHQRSGNDCIRAGWKTRAENQTFVPRNIQKSRIKQINWSLRDGSAPWGGRKSWTAETSEKVLIMNK